MKLKPTLILLLLFACVRLSMAQSSPSAARRADSFFEKGEYAQAIIDYRALITSVERDRRTPAEHLIYLYTRLGESHLQLKEYVVAAHNFARARELGATDPDFLLLYGHALSAGGRTHEALVMYRRALMRNPSSQDIQTAISRAEFNIASSSDPRLGTTPVVLETRLSHSNNQFALGYYKGSLLFSCDRVVPNPGRRSRRGVAPTRFFYSQPSYDPHNGTVEGWSAPEELMHIEADPDYFVHSLAYDEHTATYYVMRCLAGGAARDNRCNIFAYRLGANGQKSGPVQQSFHRTDANIGHPTLSSDGKVMIFTSTQDNLSNLYIARKVSENTWTDPMLMSSVINSSGNETYPRLYRDSLLFFSSDGHLGMGRADVFVSKITVNGVGHALSGDSDPRYLAFSEPINLGAPINSGADNVSFLLRPDASGGFFISNRTVRGENRSQIYSFTGIPYPLRTHVQHEFKTEELMAAMAFVEFVIPGEADTETTRLNAQIAGLNASVFELNSEMSKLNTQIAENNDELMKPDADREQLSASRARLNEQKAGLDAEVAKLNAEIATLNNELAAHNQSTSDDMRSKFDEAITAQNAKITVQNAEVTEQNAQIAKINDNLTDLITAILTLDREIAILEPEIVRLSTGTDAEQPDIAAERARLDADMERLEVQRAQLRDEQTRLNAEKDQLNTAGVRCHEELTKSNLEIARLNAEIARLIAADPRHGEDLARSNAEIARLNEEIARLSTAAAATATQQSGNQQAGTAGATTSQHSEELARSNAEITRLNEEIARLSAVAAAAQQSGNQQAGAAGATTSQQSEELARSNAEITRLNEEIARLSAVAAAAQQGNNQQAGTGAAAAQRGSEQQAVSAGGGGSEIARLDNEIARLAAEIDRLGRTSRSTGRDTVYIERIVEVPVETIVERAVQGETGVLRNVFFENNSAEIKPESRAELDRFLRAMQQHPNTRIEVSGHTDVVGTLDHNQRLSETRARAICNYLTRQGIDASRLRCVGYNFSKPIAPNNTPEGRAQNRRTEIKVL